jgi:hypothetical protein
MQNICDATHNVLIITPIEVASGPNFGYDHPHARHFTYIPRTDQTGCIMYCPNIWDHVYLVMLDMSRLSEKNIT